MGRRGLIPGLTPKQRDRSQALRKIGFELDRKIKDAVKYAKESRRDAARVDEEVLVWTSLRKQVETLLEKLEKGKR